MNEEEGKKVEHAVESSKGGGYAVKKTGNAGKRP